MGSSRLCVLAAVLAWPGWVREMLCVVIESLAQVGADLYPSVASRLCQSAGGVGRSWRGGDGFPRPGTRCGALGPTP